MRNSVIILALCDIGHPRDHCGSWDLLLQVKKNRSKNCEKDGYSSKTWLIKLLFLWFCFFANPQDYAQRSLKREKLQRVLLFVRSICSVIRQTIDLDRWIGDVSLFYSLLSLFDRDSWIYVEVLCIIPFFVVLHQCIGKNTRFFCTY